MLRRSAWFVRILVLNLILLGFAVLTIVAGAPGQHESAPRLVANSIRLVAPLQVTSILAAAPQIKWVTVPERNVRIAPNTVKNKPLRTLTYREQVSVTEKVTGEDPYGTGQRDWYKLANNTYVWAQNLTDTDPGPPVTKPVITDKVVIPQPKIQRTAYSAPTGGVSLSMGINWLALRMCESTNNYGNNDTGHNGHYGAYQFDLSTWRSVGGTGNPANASPAEQDMRAQMLYVKRGLQPWQCGWAARK